MFFGARVFDYRLSVFPIVCGTTIRRWPAVTWTAMTSVSVFGKRSSGCLNPPRSSAQAHAHSSHLVPLNMPSRCREGARWPNRSGCVGVLR